MVSIGEEFSIHIYIVHGIKPYPHRSLNSTSMSRPSQVGFECFGFHPKRYPVNLLSDDFEPLLERSMRLGDNGCNVDSFQVLHPITKKSRTYPLA